MYSNAIISFSLDLGRRGGTSALALPCNSLKRFALLQTVLADSAARELRRPEVILGT